MVFSFSKLLALATLISAAHAFSGDGTYYLPNGGFGACGQPLQNSDHVVALASAQYSNGANCGRQIQVTYNGNSVTARVADLCPGCSSGDVDLTSSAFQVLAPLALGRIPVTWNYI
ncbi:riboflavine-aldehyde-forming enzyme [Hymenopellis radicata]|nr:riboflavine-aldehyde-forming enzyme [Hymenopellis radicata]